MTSFTKGVVKTMSKKIFTFALLAVFVLAQFSIASASTVAGAVVTLEPVPAFLNSGYSHPLVWSVTGMPATGPQYVAFWFRAQSPVPGPWLCSGPAGPDVTSLTNANGTYIPLGFGDPDQTVIEFLATVTTDGCGTVPSASTPAMTSTFVDDREPVGFAANPPKIDGTYSFYLGDDNVSCNTFEMWALASETLELVDGEGYSGFDSWNETATGTFAPPAPEGPENELFSWTYTFPSTASGNWSFSIHPEDKVGNTPGNTNFRGSLPIQAAELADCADFTDTAGNADETYIRYLADLDLIAGNPDGSYGPGNTLTRAEASVLFVKANGDDETTIPTSAPSPACTFSDVSASDWFSGWVWAACDAGFMNGVGGGKFDPSNLLTRGQIVTIMNNIVNMDISNGGYLDGWTECMGNQYCTTLGGFWGYFATKTPAGKELRETAWTDVSIGAYYAIPVVRAYGVGIAEGTSATTFSPDAPISRGLFAKWLYRALSRTTGLD
jgi:hypothetical protein